MQWLFPQQFDRSLKHILNFVLMFCVGAIVVSCTAAPNNSSSTSRSSSQVAATESLNVAVIPWQSLEEQKKKLQSLANYLQQTMNCVVNFQIAKTFRSPRPYHGSEL